MSAHRQLWAGLHPSGKCDTCDDERDQREWEDEQEQRDEPAPTDRGAE